MKNSELRKIIREEIEQLVKPELKKGVWIQPTEEELSAFKKELFNMIDSAYKSIGGHPSFKSPEDINTSDVDYWQYINLDNDPEPDAVSAGKTKKGGIKYTTGATDGTPKAKREYLGLWLKSLKKPGYYVEVSHKLADILLTRGTPVVGRKNVEKLLYGKNIKWLGSIPGKQGNGWYERSIGGVLITKIMLGTPKI